MKTRLPLLFLCVFVTLLGIGCVGNKARDTVLSPALQSATPNVLADAAAAPSPDAAVTAKFKAAVDAKDWTTVSVLWPQVKALALKGIDAKVANGSIGPAVADSLKERVARYDADVQKMGGVR